MRQLLLKFRAALVITVAIALAASALAQATAVIGTGNPGNTAFVLNRVGDFDSSVAGVIAGNGLSGTLMIGHLTPLPCQPKLAAFRLRDLQDLSEIKLQANLEQYELTLENFVANYAEPQKLQ